MDYAVFNWSFPGGMAGLAAAFLSLLALAALSYSFHIRKANAWAKALLIGVRLLFLGGILYCLCNPERVVEKPQKGLDKPKLAIVLDESSSMLAKDPQGRCRLDGALAEAKELLRAHGDTFDFRLYAFSDGVRKLKSLDEAGTLKPASTLRSTSLYKSVGGLARDLSSDFRAAICLTDGVDSSSSGRIEEALDAFGSGSPPFFFKAAKLPLKSKELVEIARIESPSAVKVGSSAAVSMTIRCSGLDPGEALEAVIRKNGKVICKEKLQAASSGTFTKAVGVSIPILTPMPHSFDASIVSGGKEATKARWSINGVDGGRLKALLYMGSLDWGARFMRRTFDDSDRIALDVKYAPDFLGSKTAAEAKAKSSFLSSEELEKYDVALFMNLRRQQIGPEMERMLDRYVDNGGALLFIVSNTETAEEYANSPVERMLPVVFEREMSSRHDAKTRQFLERMQRFRDGLSMNSGSYKNAETLELPPLTSFELTEAGLSSGIFSYAMADGSPKPGALPAFEDFALVASLKPGADALAVHPAFGSAEGSGAKRLLLASQRFGKGRSAALACDPLWRWKLSMDSKSSSYEDFWNHLLSWLCAGQESQPHWMLNSLVLESGRPVEMFFKIPPRTLKFSEISFASETSGRLSPLTMKPTERPDEFKTEVVPIAGATTTLLARVMGRTVAEASFSGGPAPQERELEMLRPDIPSLARMARASGGALVSRLSEIDLDKYKPSKEDAPKIREASPLWHNPAIFILLLGALCAEMAIRRAFRMI